MGIVDRLVLLMVRISPRFVIRWVSRRYIAGVDIDAASRTIRRLQSQGCCATLDVLGEEIQSIDEVSFFESEYQMALQRLIDDDLDANLSIKPTAFGLLIDEVYAREKITALTAAAGDHHIHVRLDMEDHRVTDGTIRILKHIQEAGYSNIGIVLQGRLFRTAEDIQSLTEELGAYADFRICKGIYLEPAEIAHTGHAQIVDATCEAIDAALAAGAYVGIATHDDKIVESTRKSLSRHGLGPSYEDKRKNAPPSRKGKGPGYEYQMLLGVRGELRRALVAEGHRVRIYIPYGKQWYEYSMRRLRENPTIARHILKAFFLPWKNRP